MQPFELSDLFTGKLVKLASVGTTEFSEAMARWSNDAEYVRQLDSTAARPQPASYFMPEKDDDHRSQEVKFAIRTLADDKLIGMGDLEIMLNHSNAWLGMGIGEPDYRGKGY